jgi:membrane associated rhomboid family serine protease
MFPLRDNIRSDTFPIVNYTIIGVCTVVFLLQVASSPRDAELIQRYGLIPSRITAPEKPVLVKEYQLYGRRAIEVTREAAPAAVPPLLTLLTCIFLHGGWLHFLGNMWFLHIFGDNVEDRLGHFGFLIFYLACGVLASLVHLASNPNSTIPTIGASGAIAGVMGAYFVFYPGATVMTMVTSLFITRFLVLPAWFFLGLWIVFQLVNAQVESTTMQSGGVAWWAHIGGFFSGVVWALACQMFGWGRCKVVNYYSNTRGMGLRRYRDIDW